MSTVECRYNAVQHNTILHATLQWLKSNINHNSNPQKTPQRASYGVPVVRVLEKIDRVITALLCIQNI